MITATHASCSTSPTVHGPAALNHCRSPASTSIAASASKSRARRQRAHPKATTEAATRHQHRARSTATSPPETPLCNPPQPSANPAATASGRIRIGSRNRGAEGGETDVAREITQARSRASLPTAATWTETRARRSARHAVRNPPRRGRTRARPPARPGRVIAARRHRTRSHRAGHV